MFRLASVFAETPVMGGDESSDGSSAIVGGHGDHDSNGDSSGSSGDHSIRDDNAVADIVSGGQTQEGNAAIVGALSSTHEKSTLRNDAAVEVDETSAGRFATMLGSKVRLMPEDIMRTSLTLRKGTYNGAAVNLDTRWPGTTILGSEVSSYLSPNYDEG